MGLLERMMRENVVRGIVPLAAAQHSKYLTCEECGHEIFPRGEGWEGRYDDGSYNGKGIPVYKHADGFCADEKGDYDPWVE